MGDIDFLRRTLNVARQVQRVPGGYEIRAPKYEANGKCTWRHRSVSDASEHLSGAQSRNAVGWIFTGEADEPSATEHSESPLANSPKEGWRRRKPSRASTTCATKFYASGLIAAGCDVVTVQRALGHASAKTTTLNTYSHL